MENKFTDSQYLDFIDMHEPSIHANSYFTILTQHINREVCQNIREFCEYGLTLEQMLENNNIGVLDWHSMPHPMQDKVLIAWAEENRALTPEERKALDTELNEYWENLAANEK